MSPIGSKVFLSIEEIDFGELAPGKSEHRIIILYNLSQTNKLKFRFKKTGLICSDILNLEPLEGNLDPGQFIEIKLSLISNVLPSIYEGEIECGVYWNIVQPPAGETSTTQSQTISKDSNLNIERETLLLRIKKHSKNLVIFL